MVKKEEVKKPLEAPKPPPMGTRPIIVVIIKKNDDEWDFENDSMGG